MGRINTPNGWLLHLLKYILDQASFDFGQEDLEVFLLVGLSKLGVIHYFNFNYTKEKWKANT